MVRNDRLAEIMVDPRTGDVTLDGDPLSSSPADTVHLSRLYFL
jgi:urease subunit alpha